jgi:hypothetical protein
MSQPEKLNRGDSYTGWFVDWIEEWSQFFSDCNWYTFHPIQIEVEDDRIMGGVEATVIVLGIGVRVRWNYAKTEKVAQIIRAVDKIREGRE